MFKNFSSLRAGAMVISVALVHGLAGCSSGGQTVAGTVYMGAVAGATVSAYAIGSDGSVGVSPIATATTDASGTFSLPVNRWPLLIRATNGTYTEEATGTQSPLGAGGLQAVYTSEPAAMVVTPYSSAVVASARAAGGLTASNIASAVSTIGAFMGDIDPEATPPAVLSAGTAASAIDAANKMALALGAESQSRTDARTDLATSIASIVAQAAAGDTLSTCNGGAGDPNTDGTISTPATSDCTLTQGALRYAQSARNTSGITTITAFDSNTTVASANQTASASGSACTDRVALLVQNLALFDGRRADVQANLVGGLTAQNWSTFKTRSTWGPTASRYGALSMPAGCGDLATFQRELVIAAENYWIDQGINYCHHHVPGWTPPDLPNYRNSSAGSTSGGSSNGMTCTAQRAATGEQIVAGSGAAPFPAAQIQWNGVDCSDFTSWIYNFVGLTGPSLPTGIGSQACETDEGTTGEQAPGVLLDINAGNVDSMIAQLQPGDLLYITQSDAQHSGDYNGDYQLAHVITWTGKRWNDLQSGADAADYALANLGKPGSRLGGDFAQHVSYPLSQLATNNPWMIIDSHYAGPAYRPFDGWYKAKLSNVRRIIAADAARRDPTLSPYVIGQISQDTVNGTVTLASPHANASGSQGWRLVYQTKTTGTPMCYRAGIAH